LDLAANQLHRNDYFVRHSRRLLQERFAAGMNIEDARKKLFRMLDTSDYPVDRQLRFLWALHSTGGVGEERLTTLLDHANEHVRSWAVRLIGEEDHPTAKQFEKIRKLASDGESRLVRLYVASTFPRFSESQKWILAKDLLLDFGYASDQNLPYMIWYALLPLVEANPDRAMEFLASCSDAQVYKNIARRIASDFDLNSDLMEKLVEAISRTLERGDLLQARAGVRGIEEALHGLKGIQAPSNWATLTQSVDAGVRTIAVELEPVFDQSASMTQQDWLALLENQSRRNQAIRELAAFDDTKIAAAILRPYRRYLTDDRQATMATLSSRISFAETLVYAIKNGIVPRRDLSAFHARQIHNLGNAELNELLEEVWGELRQSPAEKRAQIADWENKLTSDRLGTADIASGKKLFQESCASCHSLFGEGGNLGPDLNGSDRQNVYYLLENLIDPSAVLPQDYKMNILTLKDGRVLSGNIIAQSRHSLTLAGLNSVDVIPVSEVVKQEQLEQSTMPEGLLGTLGEQDVVDLIGYLQQ